MNLNTNYSTTNQHPTFQASFKTEIPVNNMERLTNIMKIFSEKTQHYANDTLTLSMSKDPAFAEYPILRTTDEIHCEEYSYSHLAPNLDELMQTMSDSQIAKKLISFFKAMKKEEQIDIKMADFDKSIEHLKATRNHNKKLAESCSRSGQTKLESQFANLAKSNQLRLNNIQAEKSNTLTVMINDLRKITKNEPDLEELPKIYTEFHV